jgi:hypothetical protein
MSWVRLEDFGQGLNLSTGPLEPSYAIDALDVTYGRAIRTRPGWSYLTSASSLYTKLHGWRNTSGTKYLLAARSGNTDAIDDAGNTDYTVAKTFTDAVSFGSPGNEVVYLANGSDTVFKFTGSAFSAPANQPEAKYLAVQSPDNRLVATGFIAGSNGPASGTVSESTVHFSDEGAPETWTANNKLELTPGDGEKIMGCFSWRNLVFVWKETKYFVFTGNGVGVDGHPEFIYRQVDGAGLVAPNAVATSPEGVYFLAKDGIYFTNGGNPERILEQEMGPIFTDATLPFFTSGTVTQANISRSAASFWKGRLYVSLPMNGSSTNNRVVVYDRAFGWWSIYSIAAADLTVWNPSSTDELMFAHTGNKIARHNETITTDNSSPIISHSRQAWLDAGARMSIRQFKVWGDGLISCSAAVDYAASTGPTVTADLRSDATLWGDGSGDAPWGDGSTGFEWGPEGTYRHKTLRGFASRGYVFSFLFRNTSTSTPMAIEQASVELLGGVNREQ